MALLGLTLCTALLSPIVANAFTEAPALARQVADGKLPALAKRLPEKPETIKPFGVPGHYGGLLRTALRGDADYNAITRLVGPQGLMRWTPDYTKVVPNVAESWSANADNSEYTFKLRQGMRWSDGEPFNADDILFAMNDIVGNKQFFSTPPARYVINDKLVSVDKIDDYTVVFKFAGPYRRFIKELATPVAQHPVLYAKHYCKQFHPKYNEHIADLLKQYKAADWQTLMRVKCGDVEAATRWGNPDRPTLDPWIVTTPYGAGTTQTMMRRNPYFWQVDTKGQQLPYIDQVQFNTINEVETIRAGRHQRAAGFPATPHQPGAEPAGARRERRQGQIRSVQFRRHPCQFSWHVSELHDAETSAA